MIEEIAKQEIKGPIPTKERNLFQIFLIKKIIGEKPPHKSNDEWNDEKANVALQYGKVFSDLIDDESHASIRSAIMAGDFEKAAEEVLNVLNIKVAA